VPLQNRVAPDGSLHAVPDRGTMLGNRGGRFHRDDKTLGKRRWASVHWICCALQYKDMHHAPMGQGYTSLFFLDEVTALAAGHRPCFFCRRKEAKAFLGAQKADVFDHQLHKERLTLGENSPCAGLTDGAMVAVGSSFFALRRGKLLRWSFAGYTQVVDITSVRQLRLLTPPAIVAILAVGYQPRWHVSALQWDD
jgi:hypothetical protein